MDSAWGPEDRATSPSLQSAPSPTPSLIPNPNLPPNSNSLNIDIFQKYAGLELAFFFRDCSYYQHVPKRLVTAFLQACKALI
jgi:hypothetical protein